MKRRRVVTILFVTYCLFLLWLTILSREPAHYRTIKLELFWSYRAWFAGESYGRTESIQSISNILLFVPFGVLFPNKVKGIGFPLLCGAVLSIAIEVIQYVFILGWCEVDDVICNTLGVAMGFCFSRILTKSLGES